ncbi:kinase-like domain-containing protein [Phlebopus sp. FC_14]|nr:kinase-like domain-containing protein [Phlebopus sp. FC_14]
MRHTRGLHTRCARTIPRPTSQTRDPASSRQVDRPPDITEQIDRENRHYYDGGGHGDVWRCIYHGTCGPVVVAVKTLRCIKGQETLQENLRRELGIWRRLNHPNIVPFLGIARGFGMRGSAALVSLWMPNGTLHVFLERNGVVLTIEDRLKILHGVASGLAYLHSFPIIHGDLTSLIVV